MDKDNITKDLSWKLFEETGEISYFMLYKALKDEETDD